LLLDVVVIVMGYRIFSQRRSGGSVGVGK
jgi:hypothetical protein